MSSIVRPPDPCLVAIILIVRSRAGPRFVFHYPPNPLSDNGLRTPGKGRRVPRAKSRQGTKSNDSGSSEESSSTSDEDDDDGSHSHLTGSGLSTTRRMSNFGLDDHQNPHAAASPMTGGSGVGDGSSQQRPGSLGSDRLLFRKRGPNSDLEEDSGAAAPERQEDGSAAARGPFTPPWESLLGLPADVWEKLLSPSRSWHKRRFEIGINDLAFVGWPVFVREDGTWRKQRRKKDKRRSGLDGKEGEVNLHDNADDSTGREESVEAMADSTDTLSSKAMLSPELKRTPGPSIKPPRASSGHLDGDDKDSMTMFNVVFVIDPPLLEYSIQTREIYDNIIKKFGQALKWELGRTDYVWREAQNISHMKEKAKEKSTVSNGLVF